ncbi:hypothetical protein [Actinoallomurus iriomotensis]|uniref:Uncharacterized protein n=1 Tax=Actinoallomurus iriomotensis TaxID=478107 RepID=A0A9W6RYS6_9ACTN|nr:hypothetical protein [Actinoallomurus iriomotensis]GLY85256.1 hypothetical protein Airi02_031850 [Actinoallomurus iriomotensis]
MRVVSGTPPGGSAQRAGNTARPYEVTVLFEPFRRLRAGRLFATVPGAGFGRSIVRSVARAPGGLDITVVRL